MDSLPCAYYQIVMHYSAYRALSIECVVKMRHFTLYFQSGAVVETLENKAAVAAEFLSSILHHGTPIYFKCFEFGQQ